MKTQAAPQCRKTTIGENRPAYGCWYENTSANPAPGREAWWELSTDDRAAIASHEIDAEGQHHVLARLYECDADGEIGRKLAAEHQVLADWADAERALAKHRKVIAERVWRRERRITRKALAEAQQ